MNCWNTSKTSLSSHTAADYQTMATTTQRAQRNPITKSDMEASRLVFVFVKDAKPKRKVAVPVPDGYSWADFLHQVKAKLRIIGVKEIFLASSGHVVTSLEELQDIDELCVVEGPEPAAANSSNAISESASARSGSTPSTSEPQAQNGDFAKQQSSKSDRHKLVVVSGPSSHTGDDEGKYRGRIHPVKRMLQKLLPSLFSPTLPVTTRDTDDDRGSEAVGRGQSLRRSIRRGRRGFFNLRNLLLIMAVLSCFGTMVWFYLKSPKLASVDAHSEA